MLTPDKINQLFDNHLKSLNDLLKEEGVDLCFDLTEDLQELKDAFKDSLNDMDAEVSLEEAMKVIEYNKNDLDAGVILPLLDDGDICDYMEEKDCLVIEVKGLMDSQRIKDFVNQNIYPYCLNDRESLK